MGLDLVSIVTGAIAGCGLFAWSVCDMIVKKNNGEPVYVFNNETNYITYVICRFILSGALGALIAFIMSIK